MLRERHMRHHFQDDTRGFGISAPYWDEVFRTSSRGRSTRGAPTAATVSDAAATVTATPEQSKP
jgi:sterol desaturase/sphingolipid hydroxylase (fatty acid hydroxylase superfamily)